MIIKRKVCAATLLVGIGVAVYCGAIAHADPRKTSDRLVAEEGASSLAILRMAEASPASSAVAGGPDVPPAPRRPGPPGGAFPPPGPGGLAGQLSMMETAIGIRSEQLDAWRDYTDALLALTQPPAPPTGSEPRVPFSWPSSFATKVMGDAKKAETLLAALERLKAKLTPAQLERVVQMEATMPPPPFGFPPPSGGRRPPPHGGMPG